ncbi:MAG: hypothetical protein MPJ50_09510 [Pirellulales bacterium]|nr:hypothetical protein [Pirellulales bacterium]
MASIAKEPNGTRRILFKAPDGKRKTLRLGKVSQKIAETYRTHVEHLVTSLRMKWSAPDETIRWLSELDETMRDKLVAVSLCPRRESQLLGPFLEEYIASRKDVRPGTLTVFGHTRRCLVTFFGEDKMREIHSGSADEFRLS